MVARNPGRVALTLLCLLVALGLATVSEANSFVHPARDHADLTRMIRKRVPMPQPPPTGPFVGAADDPPPRGTDTKSGITTGTGTGTSTGTDTGTTTGTNTKSTSTSTTGSSTSTIPLLPLPSSNATDTLTTTAANSTTSSSTTSTTSTSTNTTTSSPTTSSQTSDISSSSTSTSTPLSNTQSSVTNTNTVVETVTQDQDAQPTSAAQVTSASKDSKITKTTLTVIVAIAASLAAIAIGWTLFRKWKLRPSSNFDDRMQPIDWQPTVAEDSGLPGHRRAGSTASHGSFQSAGHSDAHGRAANNGTALDHDFTAGPATLAPVGGYADLQRGPSPQPSMTELSRGPSLTHGYDPYARTPMQHGVYDGSYDYGHGARY